LRRQSPDAASATMRKGKPELKVEKVQGKPALTGVVCRVDQDSHRSGWAVETSVSASAPSVVGYYFQIFSALLRSLPFCTLTSHAPWEAKPIVELTASLRYVTETTELVLASVVEGMSKGFVWILA